jgi:hypothetical protein
MGKVPSGCACEIICCGDAAPFCGVWSIRISDAGAASICDGRDGAAGFGFGRLAAPPFVAFLVAVFVASVFAATPVAARG